MVAGLGESGSSHSALSIHSRLVGVGRYTSREGTETQVGWGSGTLAAGVHSSPCLLFPTGYLGSSMDRAGWTYPFPPDSLPRWVGKGYHAHVGPRWVGAEEWVHKCSHRQKEQRPGCPLRCPGGSLGQGLEDGIHLLRHGRQRKLKLVLCKASGRRVRGNLASASAPGDIAGVKGAGHLERGESS